MLCLAEKLHDVASVAHRLRVDGFAVVDRPRPDSCSDLSINYGGARYALCRTCNLKPVVIDCPMTAVDVVAARITVGKFTAVIVVIYRPGPDDVQSAFFEEMTQGVRDGCRLPSTSVCGR